MSPDDWKNIFSDRKKQNILNHKFDCESKRLISLLDFYGSSIYHNTEFAETHKTEFNNTFRALLKQSKQDNYFWQHCASMVYFDNYEIRLKRYLDYGTEYDILSFIEGEKELVLKGFQKEKSITQPRGKEYVYQEKAFYYEMIIYDFSKEPSGYQPVTIKMDFLSNDNIDSLEKSILKKRDFLDLKLRELINGEVKKNPYPAIFIDANAFELFKFLLEKIGHRHLDVSFIYRTMFDDKFIHQDSESAFRLWLGKLEPFKPKLESKLQSRIHSEKPKRIEIYRFALNTFQLKSKTYP